jgi:putative PIN family toxin of toxin-antitoxin system
MRRAVLDTDVIVSGALVPEGHPGQILQAWRDGRFLLILSEDIIEEVKEVLNRPRIRDKYRHLTPATIGRLINLLRRHSVLVPGKLNLAVVTRDPDDDKVIIAAIEGRAEYIVTGDADLIDLKRYQDIRIVRPAEFIKLLT